MITALEALIPTCQARIEGLFDLYIRDQVTPARILQDAMGYGVYNGGKRIRPLLVYATGLAFNAPLENLDAPAAAVELIHSYSLIHDDLPAMDNADLRRGKPACHKVFGDAMAILAGDALQALAFDIIASHPCSLTSEQRIAILKTLGKASGPLGMAGGQALDITMLDKTLPVAQLLQLYRLKTGALLSASVMLGCLAANITQSTHLSALTTFAEAIGLAFQLQDDLLDMEGNTSVIGKPQGLDAANAKITYPMLCGVEQTRQTLQELTHSALQSIRILGDSGRALEELAHHLLVRKH
jgi:farnesyl diphosphate synthase